MTLTPPTQPVPLVLAEAAMQKVDSQTIHDVLDDLTAAGASDIQLKTGHPPLANMHGQWAAQHHYEALSGETVTEIHRKLCRDERYRDVPPECFDGDYRTSSRQNHYRVNASKEQGRLCLSLRPLPRTIPTFDDLHLIDDELGAPDGRAHLTVGMKYALSQPSGLILVTGRTGSGKSTTLASMVGWLNKERQYNIVTIEDPTEFVFRPVKSHFIQREVGVDTVSFSAALRAALRQKPDVILVGEMRDRETIEAALRAADTGHLVMSTVHNKEAAATVERIINEFPAEEHGRIRHQLSEVLTAVIYQQILPTLAGGRQIFHEMMVLTPEMRSIIRPKDGSSGGNYLEDLRAQMHNRNPLGNRSMDGELRRAADAGIIDPDVARAAAIKPERWEDRG
ncbi:Twitching motility protein PilT [Deinococcus saxicola]|uniref:type IV pilus twitching motility protein PilT n=1 Tax=Deinococcus saxicola TaxID=249406 RepID=UPI0039F0D282